MANKKLFKGGARAARAAQAAMLPGTNTINDAGAPAYALSPDHALAQLAATGTFHASYYASGEAQVERVRELADKVAPELLAKAAVWARDRGHMKDMPAALLAMLTKADPLLADRVFDRVVDNGRMLRTFVQMIRSGQFGRKSLGSGPRRLVRRWLEQRTDVALLKASVGNDPSLADVIKLAHPRPANPARQALYGWLLGKAHDAAALPDAVKAFEAWKAGNGQGEPPDVDFRQLTSLPLSNEQWAAIARKGGWTMVRMNLNTFLRHGAFDVPGTAEAVAAKLGDAAQVAKAKAFPYQLLVAWLAADAALPRVVKDALQDAMEAATANVPVVQGKVYVCPDVSGSMSSASVTGDRGSATSAVKAIDVAALVAAAVVRRNPSAEVLPFDTRVHATHDLNPRDTVLTNAAKLRKFGGGGTTVSAPLAHLNGRGATGDLVLYVSDNESWVDARKAGQATATLQAWEEFKRRSPQAKLVCIDVAPNVTTQACERPDVMNVGGFGDHVFGLIAAFVEGRLGPDHWLDEIRSVDLSSRPPAPLDPESSEPVAA